MDVLPLSDEEIEMLKSDYPADSLEYAAACELLHMRDEEARDLKEMEISLAHDDERLKLEDGNLRLRTELKELAKHIRTTEGLEEVYRLKLKGLL